MGGEIAALKIVISCLVYGFTKFTFLKSILDTENLFLFFGPVVLNRGKID